LPWRFDVERPRSVDRACDHVLALGDFNREPTADLSADDIANDLELFLDPRGARLNRL
jgi:hypothetical protein